MSALLLIGPVPIQCFFQTVFEVYLRFEAQELFSQSGVSTEALNSRVTGGMILDLAFIVKIGAELVHYGFH